MSIYIRKRIKVFKKLGDNTWDNTGEEVTEARLEHVTVAMGQKKDTFQIRITNTENNLFKTFFSGTGAQTVFNLIHYPIPIQLQTDPDRFLVIVDDSVNNDWTIDNGAGTITFGTAPSSATNNIEIRFTVFEVDDRITIEQWKDAGSPGAADLLIDGIIKKPPEEIGDPGRMMSVSGASWIESLFATLIPIAVEGTPPEIIGGSDVTSGKNGVLNLIAIGNKNRVVRWHPDNPIDKDGNTVEQGIGDNPFPTKNYVQNYKAANEIIEEVSSNDFTENGPYFVTVVTETTPNNDPIIYLKWLPKGTTTDHTFTEGTEPTNIKVDKRGDDIINAIIYPLGKDAYNISRHDVNFDPVSIGKFGQKWKFITSTGHIFNDLFQNEIIADDDKTLFNYDAQGNPTDVFPASYDYTIQTFTERDPDLLYRTGVVRTTYLDGAISDSDTTITVDDTSAFDSSGTLKIDDEFMTYTGKTATTFTTVTRGAAGSTAVEHSDDAAVLQGIVVSNDAEYNDAVYQEARWVGKNQTQRILDKLANPRFFVSLELPFTTDYIIGNIAEVTIPSYNFYSKKLRIVQIKYTPFKTDINLEEDEKTIGE